MPFRVEPMMMATSTELSGFRIVRPRSLLGSIVKATLCRNAASV
jgi:hypothetical protein